MWIGNEHLDSLLTYPDVANLSGCVQPIRMRATYPRGAGVVETWHLPYNSREGYLIFIVIVSVRSSWVFRRLLSLLRLW